METVLECFEYVGSVDDDFDGDDGELIWKKLLIELYNITINSKTIDFCIIPGEEPLLVLGHHGSSRQLVGSVSVVL